MFQLCSKFFTRHLHKVSQELIIPIFSKKLSLPLAIIYFSYPYVHDMIAHYLYL